MKFNTWYINNSYSFFILDFPSGMEHYWGWMKGSGVVSLSFRLKNKEHGAKEIRQNLTTKDKMSMIDDVFTGIEIYDT